MEKEIETIKKELNHFRSKCVDLMCEIDELKSEKAEMIKDIIKFLKEIRYGASYTWMNDKIDEKIKLLRKLK